MDLNRFKRHKSNIDWSEWLSDDPPTPAAHAKLRESRVKQANTYQRRPLAPEPKSPTPTNVTINIHMPKIKLAGLDKLKPKLPKMQYARLAKRLSAFIAVALVAFGGYSLVAKYFNSSPNQTGDSNQLGASTAYKELTFKPVTPKDKPHLGKAGGAKTAYDSTRGVYSYTDTMLGTSLTVSQQSMPGNFDSSQEAVNQVAKDTGATEPIVYSGGTAYMSTDAKSGSQTIVSSVNDLLIFIQSPSRHTNLDWKTYLESLE